ncbi:hypothetical protein GE061_005311 [Apolygus lucorum]|uniref:Uncharacterized protein n=1 Tax=Apolygus lucorum TaxID=248454 RepID=A0A6A4IWV4_APOLU|nr:hypothetical protein GE061_005311 [Apolygus lucorum]
MDPCIVEKGESCCGYPFYDCISDGRESLCQSVSDFPELSAELMLRLREAKDRGDPDATAIQRGVYDLLGTTTRRPGGGNRNPTTRSGGNRPRTTPRAAGRQTTRRTTRRPQRSSSK